MPEDLPPPLPAPKPSFGPLLRSARSPLFLWLLAVFLFGVGLRFWLVIHRPEPEGKAMLGVERLVLVADFQPEISAETRAQLREMAGAADDDPLLAKVLAGEPLAEGEAQKLTPGLRLLAEYQASPTEQKKNELQALARAAESRLFTTLGMLGCLLAGALALAFLGRGARPETATLGPMVPAAGVVPVLIVFLAWDVLNTFFLSTAVEMTHLRDHLPLVFYLWVAQGAGYLLFLGLARALGARKEWNFHRPFAAAWAGRGYFLCYALVLSVNLLIAALTGTAPVSSNPLLEMFMGGGQVWALALLVILVGPLFEELIFRGWLLGGLRERWGDGKALLVSSLLFAVIHGDPWATPALFVLGCVFGAVALRSGSLYGSLILHSLWNATTFTILYANMP